MKLTDILKSNQIKYKQIEKRGPYFRKKWEDAFIDNLSTKEKKAVYILNDDGSHGYLWHVFSYEKRECLTGNAAEEAFNNEIKNKCFIFYQHSDDVIVIENEEGFSATVLADGLNIYVVNEAFTWTFVKTHETGYCGPYFCSI